MYKDLKHLINSALISKLLFLITTDVLAIENKKPIDYVDPLIGTLKYGNVIVGPQLPHSLVKLSPHTISFPTGGYRYSDSLIMGFAHTHLEGTGGGAYGNILLVPIVGDIKTAEEEYSSKFSHDNETAIPEYYGVILEDYDIRAELTATERVGFHKYTFPESKNSHILIDIGHDLEGGCTDGWVQIVDNYRIQGYGVYIPRKNFRATYPVYFFVEFSKPFDNYGTWNGKNINPGSNEESGNDIGVFVKYTTSKDEPVKVKVGISSISTEQAHENLKKEVPDWDFEKVKGNAKKIWNDLLSRIEVVGGTEEQKVKFYTALFHSLIAPTDYTEYGHYYSAFSGKGKVYPAGKYHYYSDDWCIWDTFRTTHPLQTIIEPERRGDIIQSYVRMYEQGGWMPKCPWRATGYYGCMIGFHVASVIVDSYMKGLRDFNVDKAYEGLVKTATGEPKDELLKIRSKYIDWLGQYMYVNEFNENGYVSDPKPAKGGVSWTLEYAYNNWCMAQLAKHLGTDEEYSTFMERAQYYRNSYNPKTGFMQPKTRDGSWHEPFDPTSGFGFCESNSWQQTWFVPHDIQGLINLIGGKEEFIIKLDTYFNEDHHRQGNEPSFINPFLYNYAGAPWKTQEVVRNIMEIEFKATPDGLPGNDDGGAMSAWYVFAALGFYPVAPGQNTYVITSPIFDRVTIHLDNNYYKGEKFEIITKNNSKENKYIQSATLNGKELNKPWIKHSDVVNGGTLILQMGPTPNKKWGSRIKDAPPSISEVDL